ncbi:amidase signature domain-containing protein [Macrophomina phaseolina]|uniref:amidase n=1 Tax=Macrophomina phaseolina TaxID=35725 RepID=A0ABQ8G779_9PEZI|nr:amidase signature domain-containing protein [Macrophomina phaseolina]
MCNEIFAIQSSGKTLKRKKKKITKSPQWSIGVQLLKRSALRKPNSSRQKSRVKNIPDGLVNAVEYVQSCGLLSDEELQLTRITDARVLLDKVVSGALTSTKIASAFIKRTAILQQLTNPFNRNLISGGSSGGEGALVGGRGSILGMGTDIGGSVRIPACLQGLYGLCPTIGRVPFLKSAEACTRRSSETEQLSHTHRRDQEYIVPPVAGPLTHNLSTLEYYLDSHLSTSPWDVDPRAFPIPWRKGLAEPPKKPLKLAYIFDDGVVKPQPPVARIMREVVEKLKAVGREFIEWDTSLHKEGVRLWYEAVLADGGKGCRDNCALIGKPLIQGMVVGEEKNFLDIPERQKVRHHDQLSVAKLQYEKAFLAQWRAHLPRNDSDRSNHEQCEDLGCVVPKQFSDDHADNIDLVNGMPVGLQIVTGRVGEAKAVAVAKVLEGLPVKR